MNRTFALVYGSVYYALALGIFLYSIGFVENLVVWRAYEPLAFETPSLYKWVRHPLYVGWFTVFWATPQMSAGHLLLALVTTAYILVAVRIEEKDLLTYFGDAYVRYAERVPRFLPRRRSDASQTADGSMH